MHNEVTGLPALEATTFDIESRATDINRLGAGLTALATLMQASDPQQTDACVETPILHGLGYLVEALGAQFRAYSEDIENSAVRARSEHRTLRQHSTALDPQPPERGMSALAKWASEMAQAGAEV